MADEWDREMQQYQQPDPLAAELAPGETVLWQGSPALGAAPLGGRFQIVFSLIWLGFAVFWFLSAAQTGGAFALLGLPFVGMGVWLVYGQTLGRRRRMGRTLYAVTDRRALILVTGPRRWVRSIALSEVAGMEKTYGRTGGNLRFVRRGEEGMVYANGRHRMAEPFAFYGIDADAAQQAVWRTGAVQ